MTSGELKRSFLVSTEDEIQLNKQLVLNASRGNATYNGTKLQPNALQLLACIRV